MTTRWRRLVAVVGVVMASPALVGCGGDDSAPELAIADVVLREPAGANTALYLTVTNAGGTDDRLVEVVAPVGTAIELHETTVDDEGRMGMREVEAGIALPAGETVRLEPGGLHVMILGVSDLAVGDEIPVELRFEVSEAITVLAPVQALVGGGQHGHDEHGHDDHDDHDDHDHDHDHDDHGHDGHDHDDHDGGSSG